MKRIVAGIIAHVDAGKTTLSEALLYRSGALRQLGRVDNGDAFLDTDVLEKQRGITIFSHQANLQYKDINLTLLDTRATSILRPRLNKYCRFWTSQF